MYNGYCNEDKKIERVGALTIKVMNISNTFCGKDFITRNRLTVNKGVNMFLHEFRN